VSTAALALLVAVATVVVVSLVATTVLRSRRASERRLDAGLLAIRERMDALADELATTVERMHEDALRTRLVESLGQALDLDEVLARCAEAAAALHGVAGAKVAVVVDGVPLSAAAGLAVSAEEGRGVGTVGGPPDGSRVRAIGISYHYPVESARDGAVRSAIAIPLENGDGQLGFLTVFGYSEDPPVTGSDFQVLQAIGRHTAAAIDGAQRREAAPVLAVVDPLTGLGNRQALHGTLALEVARAHRNQQRLADVDFTHLALQLGLEVYKFQADFERPSHLKRIREDVESGTESGVKGTPTFFINGCRYRGKVDVGSMLEALKVAG